MSKINLLPILIILLFLYTKCSNIEKQDSYDLNFTSKDSVQHISNVDNSRIYFESKSGIRGFNLVEFKDSSGVLLGQIFNSKLEQPIKLDVTRKNDSILFVEKFGEKKISYFTGIMNDSTITGTWSIVQSDKKERIKMIRKNISLSEWRTSNIGGRYKTFQFSLNKKDKPKDTIVILNVFNVTKDQFDFEVDVKISKPVVKEVGTKGKAVYFTTIKELSKTFVVYKYTGSGSEPCKLFFKTSPGSIYLQQITSGICCGFNDHIYSTGVLEKIE